METIFTSKSGNMEWKCPICGKEFERFGFIDFASCPNTTLFGEFKKLTLGGKPYTVDRKINTPVCSEECKRKNEEKYFIEEYKGNKIYCANGKYMPYLECNYWYDSIDGVKYRIDNPHLIPETSNIMKGLSYNLNK